MMHGDYCVIFLGTGICNDWMYTNIVERGAIMKHRCRDPQSKARLMLYIYIYIHISIFQNDVITLLRT